MSSVFAVRAVVRADCCWLCRVAEFTSLPEGRGGQEGLRGALSFSAGSARRSKTQARKDWMEVTGKQCLPGRGMRWATPRGGKLEARLESRLEMVPRRARWGERPGGAPPGRGAQGRWAVPGPLPGSLPPRGLHKVQEAGLFGGGKGACFLHPSLRKGLVEGVRD